MSEQLPEYGEPQMEWTPDRVERRILELANRIASGVVICNERYMAFLEADRAYDLAFARAYLLSGGPAHEKKYQATADTAEEREKRDITDAQYRLAKERADALREQLRAMQSVGASVRMMYGVAGRGEF